MSAIIYTTNSVDDYPNADQLEILEDGSLHVLAGGFSQAIYFDDEWVDYELSSDY